MPCPKSAQPAHLAVRYAAFTHRGTPHRHNQDAILTAGRVIQKAEFVDGVLPLDRRQRFAVSDGVTSALADEDIAACIAAEDLAGSAHRLFDAVMAKGAPDDLSAILLAFESA